MLQLTDLDELISKINNSYVKEHVEEALSSYRARSYRAAISIIWVAVCIDIIEKIKDLALQGDKQALARVKEFENLIKINSNDSDKVDKKLAFENSLIGLAQDEFEFISQYESVQLKRLKDDRNFSVHPTFQKDGKYVSISPETVRNHIVNACNALFIFPATQSKIAIEELKDLVIGNSFPIDSKDAEDVLFTEHRLGRAKEVLIKNLLITLLKLILSNDRQSLKYEQVIRVCSAINSIYLRESQISNQVIKDKLPQLLTKINDSRIRILFILMKELVFINQYIVDTKTDKRLLSVIKSFNSEDIVNCKIPYLADKNNDIKESLLEKIKILDNDKEITYILKNSSSESLKKIAIDYFVNSPSFYDSYARGVILLNYVKFFSKNDLGKVLDGVLENNQIIPANKIEHIICNLYETSYDDDTFNKFQSRLLEMNTNNSRYLHKIIQDKMDEIPF